MTAPADPHMAGPARSALVVVLTAFAYGVIGWLALKMSIASGYASPIYPSAGVALAATIVFGPIGALGSALGSFAVNLADALAAGRADVVTLYVLPGTIAAGAGLQAALGAVLVRRSIAPPLVLRAPDEILRFGLWSLVSCLLNATLATSALGLAGSVAPADLGFTWWTWWVGDSLGVLIGTPVALTLIGQPREDWVARRFSVGVPMLLGTLMLVAAATLFHRWEQQRLRDTFESAAHSAAGTVAGRMDEALHALQATHGMLWSHRADPAPALRPAVDWWLQQVPELRAIGYSERVPRAGIAQFEARARAEGVTDYRVFDRPDSAGLAANDAEVVAIRAIEPMAGNAAALGVNAMSIAAARQAIVAAAGTGEAVSTRGFRLTQASREGETGVVVYRALYRGQPDSESARLAQWRGVVFVTLELDRSVRTTMDQIRGPLHWCLVDSETPASARRLAGDPGCERSVRADFALARPVAFAGQRWELRLTAATKDLPGGQHTGSWLFSIVGLAATSLLGMLLLTVTGRARRIEIAVDERTRALSTEVRERRSAEDALRDSEQRLRSILDHVPIGVVFLDTRGRILDTNPSLCRMLGRSAQDMARLTVMQLTHPGEHDQDLAARRELLTGRAQTVHRQMRLARADGTFLSVRGSLTALRDAQGRALRLVGVVEDISDQLRLAESERARDAAEASSRAKGEFVSRMSHELRTPLNAMLGFAQLLGMDRNPALAPHQAGWTLQIQRAGWHLLDMVNDTLDMARIESGLVQLNLQPLELAPMIEASLSLLTDAAHKRGIRPAVVLQPDASNVIADETRLKQVLTNLLSNAIKYNREGGRILVDARIADDAMVEVLVHDTGLGMTPAQLRSLFQPYNRLGQENSAIEGTGIGLVISRRLAELMGGSLDATSVVDEGSVFTLRLPQARFSDTGTFEGELGDVPAPLYERRLVHYIEDNETNIEVMRGILGQRPQITLSVSTTGLDGLSAVRQRRPDLILLDMQLPDIDGLELLRYLKRDDLLAGIAVVVVSADATPQRIEDALTLGAIQYLTKPLDITGFVQVLDTLLAGIDTRWG